MIVFGHDRDILGLTKYIAVNSNSNRCLISFRSLDCTLNDCYDEYVAEISDTKPDAYTTEFTLSGNKWMLAPTVSNRNQGLFVPLTLQLSNKF